MSTWSPRGRAYGVFGFRALGRTEPRGCLGLKAFPKRSIYIYIYTTIMELGARRPSLLWFWGPNSIFCSVYGPSGFGLSRASRVLDAQNPRLLGRGGGV